MPGQHVTLEEARSLVRRQDLSVEEIRNILPLRLTLEDVRSFFPERQDELAPYPARGTTRTENWREYLHQRLMLAYASVRGVDWAGGFHEALPEDEKALMRAERMAKFLRAQHLFDECDTRCKRNAKRRERQKTNRRRQLRKTAAADKQSYVGLWPDSHQWIATKFPARPWVSNRHEEGLKIRPLASAAAYKNIEFSLPHHVFLLVVDYDWEPGKPSVDEALAQSGLPEPNMIVRSVDNPKSGHVTWALAISVARSGPDIEKYAVAARTSQAKGSKDGLKSWRWFEAIREEYTRVLGGDLRYKHVMTKNPVSIACETNWLRHEPYDLKTLATAVTLPKRSWTAKKRSVQQLLAEQGSAGRKVTAFEVARQWAYVAIRKYWRGKGSLEDWHAEVLGYVRGLNSQFSAPLPSSHSRSIAKSIANYCWLNITESGLAAFKAGTDLPEVQAKRGRKKGQKARDEKMEEALRRLDAGESARAIARDLDIDDKTVANWKKRCAEAAQSEHQTIAEVMDQALAVDGVSIAPEALAVVVDLVVSVRTPRRLRAASAAAVDGHEAEVTREGAEQLVAMRTRIKARGSAPVFS